MSEIGQKLIAAVRARAAANPDFAYESPTDDGHCVNVFGGEGSCIVGCGALDADLIALDFEQHEANGGGVGSLDMYLAYPLDEAERYWLSDVQGAQDCGTPWGQAVSDADDEQRSRA